MLSSVSGVLILTAVLSDLLFLVKHLKVHTKPRFVSLFNNCLLNKLQQLNLYSTLVLKPTVAGFTQSPNPERKKKVYSNYNLF